MGFDPVVSLRIINNERLRAAQGWGEHRDLGGALAVTSDAPVADLNCLEAFTTNDGHIESLLDIGFALLRAFDRYPAARVTPLDRPRSLVKLLAKRGMAETGRSATMVYRGDPRGIEINADVEVRRAGLDDVRTFAQLHSDGAAWVRRLSVASTLEAINDRDNIFYLGYLDGQPVGTTHLLLDDGTAGIYGVVTMRSQRKKGVATTIMARAIQDALDAGCDVIGLRTVADGGALRLYERLGFELAHETRMFESPPG